MELFGICKDKPMKQRNYAMKIKYVSVALRTVYLVLLTEYLRKTTEGQICVKHGSCRRGHTTRAYAFTTSPRA